ncbi:conserved hypothetical protein [Thiomonas arsenitoxydans]|uniref:Uncharacterized protein n=1 Tax=Thiomonas arsenitoxydans (strain DSM 22701 / CIP 110005 / 3As) TaxID=426114 RepID=D6CSA1_THIA3|nr:hypothetical protein [Thiomonas arsenitoxydans]CAZ87629.1 Conserved hypothetical protein [Thiomonas arsenitoxydans]CQR26945.1 conserved hypothetical protein [Thiomonas arsenitoxydans]CQR30222.1 conserved hypothetical protein [Thiomonas arsenitoxydans]CQR30281.1 conserved hypothetical protein [Thiomonas arsenitoxydans]CQR32336.1 conserved hypothetical protein [Thiomonas arsenitoxydans]
MKQKINIPDSSSVSDQFAGIFVDGINATRFRDANGQLAAQDASFLKSIAEMAKVRDFIGAPEHILGRDNTKHGEIAEQVEVAVRRARDVLGGMEPTATFDGVGRTAPMDYRVGGIDVQSKFINGSNNTLSHVIDHMDRYTNFGRDGSIYQIQKEQIDQINSVLNGNTGDLSAKTVQAIRDKVQHIEQLSGKSFDEVVRPSVSDYSEVQVGKINQTIDRHESDLRGQNETLKNQIQARHQPSVAEGFKAAGSAAAVGAAVGFTAKAWVKYREGKNIFKGDFTAEDWEEVGGAALKGGVGGAIAGGAIYVLTNSAELSAPFAGAFVSAAKGVASLVSDYHAGKISMGTLIDNGLFVCSDAALVGICTAAGQTLIPIPVIGAVIGSFAGKLLSLFLGSRVQAAQKRLNVELQQFRKAVGTKYQSLLEEMDAKFQQLGDLTNVAFDVRLNENLLANSVALARAYGVPDERLLHCEGELDKFMCG